MSKDDKFLLVISDLHVGSAYALMPKGFRASTGATVSLNTGQEYLWECWQHFLGLLPQKIDVLVINGDAVEGQNLAEECRFLAEVDPNFQARAAAELLAPVLSQVVSVDKQRQVYMSRGSRYHTGRGATTEETLGLLLAAVPGPDGRHTRPWFHLTMGGVLFDIAHHQSVTIRYRGMPLEREIGFFLERTARRGDRLPAELVIVRSHTHSGYRRYEENHRMAVATPAWKLQDDFAAMSKYPNRFASDDIGAVGFRVSGGHVAIEKNLYPHPAVQEVSNAEA